MAGLAGWRGGTAASLGEDQGREGINRKERLMEMFRTRGKEEFKDGVRCSSDSTMKRSRTGLGESRKEEKDDG